MPLSPLRPRLTATQAELIFADTDHLNFCADAIDPTQAPAGGPPARVSKN
jgi:hypothetical protein